MKIVILLGSPRTHGTSTAIANRFAKTALALGDHQIRTFELNSLHYQGCQGCYTCKITLDRCVLADDLTEVLAAVQESDLVVMASPVYYGDVTSQLKGFIDRTFSYLLPDYRTNPQPSRLTPKKLLFILTQGHPDADRFDDIFPRYQELLMWLGFVESKLVRACGLGPGNLDTVSERVLWQTEEAARSLLT